MTEDDEAELDAMIEKHGFSIMVERCAGATGPDRTLDKVIADTFGIEWPSGTQEMACHFTSLFEAAMKLKPAGYRIQLDEYPDGWTVVLWPTADCPHPALGGVTNGASSPTAALAITLACLRVRAAIAARPKP